LFEGNLFWQQEGIARWNRDVFGVAAVGKMTQHQTLAAKLLIARAAIVTIATGDVIVQADSVANFDIGHRGAGLFDQAGYFVA
jgi:hypothetical protein